MLKKLALGSILTVIVLALAAYLIPADYQVSRQIVIQAKPERVFQEVNTLANWSKWMIWIRRDPAMKISYEGPAQGVGAGMSWVSTQEGSGTLVLTESVAPERIGYTLSFPGYNPSKGSLTLIPQDSATVVTWTDAGNVGNNPISRYFGLFLDGIIGPDFEAGLANLKEIAEIPEPEPTNLEPTTIEDEARTTNQQIPEAAEQPDPQL